MHHLSLIREHNKRCNCKTIRIFSGNQEVITCTNIHSCQWRPQQKLHSQINIFGPKCDYFSRSLEPCALLNYFQDQTVFDLTEFVTLCCTFHLMKTESVLLMPCLVSTCTYKDITSLFSVSELKHSPDVATKFAFKLLSCVPIQ